MNKAVKKLFDLNPKSYIRADLLQELFRELDPKNAPNKSKKSKK